jgi:hypothetical protein
MGKPCKQLLYFQILYITDAKPKTRKVVDLIRESAMNIRNRVWNENNPIRWNMVDEH